VTQIQGIEDDQFSRTVIVNGGKLDEHPELNLHLHWFLRSAIDKTSHLVVHQLYFDTTHWPPRSDYNSATEENAEPLPIKTVYAHKACPDRDCLEWEDAVVALDEARLRSHLQTGFRIKVSGRDGSAYILTVTPEMIRLQFEAINRVLQSLGAAAQRAVRLRRMGYAS
jgi:hypothetical protein